MRVAIRRWAAWAPGLESDEAWMRWAEAPEALGRDAVPDAKFLPAMLRRRCTPLSKILLKVAADASGDDAASVRTVFASRHGSINESLDLLECVAKEERISPAKFSHTVHNAQAGLFSIANGNREASSSLAAREDTFGSGFLETLGHLEREPGRAVLFVTGDVPLADTFAALVDEAQASYGVALLCAVAGDDEEGVSLSLEPSKEASAPPPWPDAASFLGFWLRGDPGVELTTPRHRWHFQRRGG